MGFKMIVKGHALLHIRQDLWIKDRISRIDWITTAFFWISKLKHFSYMKWQAPSPQMCCTNCIVCLEDALNGVCRN